MKLSKFEIGDDVVYTSSIVGRPGAEGVYTVTRVLPFEGVEQRYRIKSESEAHERVVNENQLESRPRQW